MRQLWVADDVDASSIGYVFEVDGRAVLALKAASLKQAGKLCAAPWFAEALAQYRSGGAPLWPARATGRVRAARPDEAIELRVAQARERAERTAEDFVFAFLVPVDLRPN